MAYMHYPLLVVALLSAITGSAGTAQPVGDTLLFVPPVDEQALPLVDTGTECIALNRIRSTRIIAGEGIVYQMAGRKAVINRPRHGGARLARDQILITRTRGAMLCAGDIVHLADSLPGMTAGFVALGRFETHRPHATRR